METFSVPFPRPVFVNFLTILGDSGVLQGPLWREKATLENHPRKGTPKNTQTKPVLAWEREARLFWKASPEVVEFPMLLPGYPMDTRWI